MRVTAIVPAAGIGLRLQSKIAKPFVKINSQPLILHTLRKLSLHSLIDDIIVVFNGANITQLKQLIAEQGIAKVSDIVVGGETRTESVRNGLQRIGETDIVLIHDGARPFFDQETISKVIAAAKEYGAAVVGVSAKSTLKEIKHTEPKEIKSTLDRNAVWEIQTPQVFRKDLIVDAYERIDGKQVWDDASLVERLGHRVVVVPGSYFNIKITTPEDLVLAQAIDSSHNASR